MTKRNETFHIAFLCSYVIIIPASAAKGNRLEVIFLPEMEIYRKMRNRNFI